MAFQLQPNEFHVLADRFVIKTRVPMASLTDAMLLVRVRNANLTAGDKVNVQCMNHEYDTLLHEAEFVVYSRKEMIRIHEVSDRETKQVNEVTFLVARIGEWWASPAAPQVEGLAVLQEQTVTVLPDIVWNPGKLAHQVIAADGTVLAAFTKDQGGKEAAAAFIAEPKAA